MSAEITHYQFYAANIQKYSVSSVNNVWYIKQITYNVGTLKLFDWLAWDSSSNLIWNNAEKHL